MFTITRALLVFLAASAASCSPVAAQASSNLSRPSRPPPVNGPLPIRTGSYVDGLRMPSAVPTVVSSVSSSTMSVRSSASSVVSAAASSVNSSAASSAIPSAAAVSSTGAAKTTAAATNSTAPGYELLQPRPTIPANFSAIMSADRASMSSALAPIRSSVLAELSSFEASHAAQKASIYSDIGATEELSKATQLPIQARATPIAYPMPVFEARPGPLAHDNNMKPIILATEELAKPTQLLVQARATPIAYVMPPFDALPGPLALDESMKSVVPGVSSGSAEKSLVTRIEARDTAGKTMTMTAVKTILDLQTITRMNSIAATQKPEVAEKLEVEKRGDEEESATPDSEFRWTTLVTIYTQTEPSTTYIEYCQDVQPTFIRGADKDKLGPEPTGYNGPSGWGVMRQQCSRMSAEATQSA